MDDLLLDTEIVLEKMQMKGGWTYAMLPDVVNSGKKKFGWTKLNALIDDYPMNNASLMPLKGGRLFLAIKTEIRKKIGKEAGDTVRVRLYGSKPPDGVGEADFIEALKDDPIAYNNYQSFTAKEQQVYVQWIFEVSETDAIVERIATAINDIADGKTCRYVKK